MNRPGRGLCSFAIALTALMVLVTDADKWATAADPNDLVVLLHPKMKDWEKPIAAAKAGHSSYEWGVYSYHPKRREKVAVSPVRLEVGDSFKKVEDWTMLIQFSAPAFGVLPNGLGPGVAVPFVVRYRPAPDAKPVDVAGGTVAAQGASYPLAVERICRAPIRGISESLTHTDGARIFADKPTVADSHGTPYTFAPVTLNLKASPPTASVRMHNRFPVPVGVFLELQNKFALASGDQSFTIGTNSRGEPVPHVVEAGEKTTVTIALKDLKPGQEPRWCKLIGLYLMNPSEAPEKP